MTDQKNTIIAIVLSAVVLIGWQYFFGMPQLNKQKQIVQQQQAQQAPKPAPGVPGQAVPAQPAGTPPVSASTAGPPAPVSRDAALAASPRVKIATPSIEGTIALKGGRIDDISLTKYRETVDPKSPPIVLLAPSGSPEPFYADFGWLAPAGSPLKLPGPTTEWKQDGTGTLGVGHPVTLSYDNGDGLVFHRTFAVDDKYLFTVKDEVTNSGSAPVTLYPYGQITREGAPKTLGYYILHEGLIGVMGNSGLQEITYSKLDEKKPIQFDVTNAWMGITDKYWAAVLLPDTAAHVQAQFAETARSEHFKVYQTRYAQDAQTIAPGATGSVSSRLFAGAKEVRTINGYDDSLHLNRFDLLIDWGWFYFITKPMFYSLDWIYGQVGNFGIAILLITIAVKILFFPLANKSYASMAKMKTVQPMMQELRQRYPDDKMKQQQEMMEIYKREKINPIAGCLPIAIQIPVFFALYKTLFITIEMRHAPFFGWIHDLSAQDPTNIFNLFGLIPLDPTMVPMIGHFLHLGAWPLIMGITMWFQMKLNPTPPDPTQAMIFNWMPVIFTFMLASFPAGLVIYWAWNNTLSVIQQSVIMKRNGAKIELFDNLKAVFGKKKPAG
jgi:YidC/Oxa1 family membrane protein insertase